MTRTPAAEVDADRGRSVRDGLPMTADDVLTRAAPPPDLVVSYGPGDDQVADVRLPPSAGPAGPSGGPARRWCCSCTAGSGGRPTTGRTPARWLPRSPPLVLPCARQSSGAPASLVAAGRGPSTTSPPPWTRCPALVRERRWRGRDQRWACDPRRALGRRSPRPVGSGPAQASAGCTRGTLPESRVRGRGGAGRRQRPGCLLTPCGSATVRCVALLGGGPTSIPERYRMADPMRLLPLGCPVRLVHGSADDVVPCALSRGFLAPGPRRRR